MPVRLLIYHTSFCHILTSCHMCLRLYFDSFYTYIVYHYFLTYFILLCCCFFISPDKTIIPKQIYHHNMHDFRTTEHIKPTYPLI